MATVKIKCHNCGKKYEVTESDKIRHEWDFTGPDYYVFQCPHCPAHEFVDCNEFKYPKKSFWDKVEEFLNK